MSRKKKHTEFQIIRMKHDFFGVMLPKGAVCGRFTWHGQTITYILSDFRPFMCGKTCHYHIWVLGRHGKWFKTTTPRCAAYRALAEMLTCNLYLNNLTKFDVSLHLDIEQEADHEEIMTCAPHERKIQQYI